MDIGAVIFLIAWNLFVIWVCLKLLTMRNNFIDAMGGDSRKPERNMITKAVAEYTALKKSLKRDALLAKRAREKRGQHGR